VNDEVPRIIGGWFTLESIANPCRKPIGPTIFTSPPKARSSLGGLCGGIRPSRVNGYEIPFVEHFLATCVYQVKIEGARVLEWST